MTEDRYRPGYHFTPARNWMNDPNGLVWHDGEYHLFFQHNPAGNDWGNMSWGHAVSPDLVHWEELPVALACDDTEQVFSGCVVFDRDDTSGLGEPGRPPLVAVYTRHDRATGQQQQALASSTDRGRTWRRYAGNPVLDIGSTEFRDPKVLWSAEAGHWVMLVALAAERVIRFYSSTDLRSWEHLSDFGPAGSSGGLWECPDLVRLDVEGAPGRSRWVLVVSVQDGAPAGGSGTQYFVGDFDGLKFTADRPDEVAWVDHGADYYAAVSFADSPDGRSVHLGWMSNWRYAREVPAGQFRGAMSLPRACSLRTRQGRDVLVQRPVLPAWTDPVHVENDLAVDGTIPLPRTASGDRLRVRVTLQPGTAERVGLRLRAEAAEGTEVAFDAATSAITLDRSASGETGFHPDFPAEHRAPYQPEDGTVELDVLVDTCSVEVFAGAGEVVLTGLVFPDPASVGVELFAEGGTALVRSLEVSRLTT